MMNAALSMCGWTGPMPARLAIERTQRWAVRRSRRPPSWRGRIGPDVRSPMARSMVRAALGTSGIEDHLVVRDDEPGLLDHLATLVAKE